MNKSIKILDCTLRDGGYVNKWEFGLDNIRAIICQLQLSNIDYIECGFINNIDNLSCMGKSIFSSVNDMEKIIKIPKTNLAMMLLPDEYKIDQLPLYNNGLINCIRLSFHKQDLDKAMDYALKIKENGYKLFFQPTVIMSYSDNEILKLINYCNDILKPDVVGIIDTLGEMLMCDVKRITKLFDENLDVNIKLLFHGHNNLQMAFSNAITFIENINLKREIIVDASLMGMGKDAGNLPIELIIDFLNKYYNGNYRCENIYKLLDDIIIKFSNEYNWGYNPNYMINGKNKVHSSYGKYLKRNKKDISISQYDILLQNIPIKDRSDFNKEIIKKIINKE